MRDDESDEQHIDQELCAKTPASIQTRPREHSLSSALLTRVFHQPSLVYFNAVAECLSVREAARRLNVASSAVTRQVANLEDALGMALLRRGGRRLSLAPAGEILYRHSRRLTGQLEAVVSELDLLRGLKAGSVRIASVESVGHSILPELISDFSQKYPGLHLDVAIVSAADVIARLANERADIGFGFIIGEPRLVEIAVRRDVPIGILMRPDHALTLAQPFTLDACFAFHIAVAKREISIREVIEPFLMRSDMMRFPFIEVDSIRMLVELALAGRHVSIMTPIGAQREISEGRLVFRALEDPGLPSNRFGLMIRADATLPFAPAVFFEHAKRFIECVELPGAL